jgi:hypothetical protein
MRPRLWQQRAPAAAWQIARLRAESGLELPWAYLHLLQTSNGGEGFLPVPPGRFVLWPAQEVLALNRRFDVHDNYPGLFGFGSDGAATLLALDMRLQAPWPVVHVPFIGLVEEIREVASSFETLRPLLGHLPARGAPTR